jgi:hypothetical protein
MGLNIPHLDSCGQSQFRGRSGDELGVGIRFRAAKPVVQMGHIEGDPKPSPEFNQDVQETQGIRSAGDRDHKWIALGDQIVLPDEVEDLRRQRVVASHRTLLLR